MNENQDPLLLATVKPNISELIKAYEQCSPRMENWNRLSTNDNIRLCRWNGQSDDGKKWDVKQPAGQRAFPFDGASDARTFSIDELINELVAVECVAFWRSLLRVQGVEAGDIESAAYATKLFEWVMGTKQYRELVEEVELHSQYTHTYGWSVLYITWAQEHLLKRVTATMQEIVQMAQAAQASRQPSPESALVSALPEMIMDPVMEESVASLMMQSAPGLTMAKARRAVRDLRTHGTAEIVRPYLCKNEPCVRALKPWEEVFVSNYTNDIQKSRVFVKEWITEDELRSRAYTDQWDERFVELASKQKGVFTIMGDTLSSNTSTLTRALDGTQFSTVTLEEETLIEIIHSYVRQLDPDNVPGIYVTTFHASLSKDPRHPDRDVFARHELLDYAHGKMPFVVRKREHLARSITSSRGLPEIFYTTQRSIKVQEDAVTDNTSLSVFPPILVNELGGVDYKFGPGTQVPVQGLGTGREPRFMEVPGANTKIAFDLMDRLEKRMDRYGGRIRADEPTQGAQAVQQRHVQSNLISWTEAFQQEFALIQQYLPAADFQRITGSEGALANDPETIARQPDFILTFDVRELDTEFVIEKLKAIKDVVLPMDAAGRIDRAKLVELLMKAIDPTLAKELIVDNASASKQLFDRVKSDLIGMMAGFEPEYVEMDPTAGTQLQFAQQLLQTNPKLQQALMQDENTRKLFENWMKNRQQSIMQEQNKVVGRIGVNPESMLAAG